jgi:hypothetical protein
MGAIDRVVIASVVMLFQFVATPTKHGVKRQHHPNIPLLEH